MIVSCTNVGWVLDFCNNRPLRVFENVQNLLRTTWSRYFEKNSEPKNQSLSGWVIQNLQRTAGSHERTGKDPTAF
jgi:hypothetical protein